MNLPKVFQNNNIKTDNISQNVFYSDKNNKETIKITEKVDNYLIEKKINNLFNSTNYVYKLKVFIKTKDEEFNTIIIGKNAKYLITLDNKRIDISSILDIREI